MAQNTCLTSGEAQSPNLQNTLAWFPPLYLLHTGPDWAQISVFRTCTTCPLHWSRCHQNLQPPLQPDWWFFRVRKVHSASQSWLSTSCLLQVHKRFVPWIYSPSLKLHFSRKTWEKLPCKHLRVITCVIWANKILPSYLQGTLSTGESLYLYFLYEELARKILWCRLRNEIREYLTGTSVWWWHCMR